MASGVIIALDRKPSGNDFQSAQDNGANDDKCQVGNDTRKGEERRYG